MPESATSTRQVRPSQVALTWMREFRFENLPGPGRLGDAPDELGGIGEHGGDPAQHRGGGGADQPFGFLDAEHGAEALADVRDPALLVGDDDAGDRRGDQAVEQLGLIG